MKNNTVFVLLAGGKSQRMGIEKGLLPFNDSFWILEQLNRISKTTIKEVFIGLGFHYNTYFSAIPWLKKSVLDFILYKNLKIRVVVNPNPEMGSFSTLQKILTTLPKDKLVVINPIDIPILNTIELQAIIDCKSPIVIPCFEDKNGHPIKLEPTFWHDLLLLDPTDSKSRLDLEIKKANPQSILFVKIKDNSALKNLNTPENWEEYLKSIYKKNT